MKLHLLKDARLDLADASSYYGSHSQAAYRNFMAAVRAATQRIGEMPHIGRRLTFSTRQYLICGFPYTLLYAAKPDRILIVALTHHSRNPDRWLHRALRVHEPRAEY